MRHNPQDNFKCIYNVIVIGNYSIGFMLNCEHISNSITMQCDCELNQRLQRIPCPKLRWPLPQLYTVSSFNGMNILRICNVSNWNIDENTIKFCHRSNGLKYIELDLHKHITVIPSILKSFAFHNESIIQHVSDSKDSISSQLNRKGIISENSSTAMLTSDCKNTSVHVVQISKLFWEWIHLLPSTLLPSLSQSLSMCNFNWIKIELMCMWA